MKKSIKKNLDQFKAKQIGYENFSLFKRLSNKQSTLIPNIFEKIMDAQNDIKPNKQSIKRRRNSSISNSTINENSENDQDKKTENKVIKRKNSKKKAYKIAQKGSDFDKEIIKFNQINKNEKIILPEIKPIKAVVDENYKRFELNNNQRLEIQIVYKNLRDKISNEIVKMHPNLRNPL